MTEELMAKFLAAETLTVLEDIYLPYRPKRRTRGMIARELGLEPLAELILSQDGTDPEQAALGYIDPEKEGLKTADQVLSGARDIIAERINEDAEARAVLRKYFFGHSVLHSSVVKGKEEVGAKYRDYFDFSEPAAGIPSHRLLAIRRGAEEGVLSFRIQPDEEEGIELLKRQFVKSGSRSSFQVALASDDAYRRLLSLSLETEVRTATKEAADEYAIRVFAENLRELLLASPLGQKAILALDPGLRTGCKLVCLNRQGKLIHNETIYPLMPHNRTSESEKIIVNLVEKHSIEAIAIGNGTGGREALSFVKGIRFDRNVIVVMVNESGASVYSASEVARREFPDHDVTVRGAVSIGRRLMDPLAELVKIDPKSIGVGQYQHDVDQRSLKKSLDDVVVSCVNAVGVDVNTASRELLSYVSGLSERLAGNMVAYRDENGPFKTRQAFIKVTGMGPKTFEQSAGFLRIPDGENPLDRSAVHPESYFIVENMARDLGCSVENIIKDSTVRGKIRLDQYVKDNVGLPTLQDIIKELAKPGRDPRKEFEAVHFTDGVNELSDVKPGMVLPGVVTNVTAFGAFVDIGVHQDGLVHISQLADRFVSNPSEVVKVGQRVQTTVIDVDIERKRISLSMKSDPDPVSAEKQNAERPKNSTEKQRKGNMKSETFAMGGRDDTYSFGSVLAGKLKDSAARQTAKKPEPEAEEKIRPESRNPFASLLDDWREQQ